MERTPDQVKEIARGGYVLKDSGGKPDIILIATGSEMEITLQAAEKLAGEGRNVRVVSLPSTDIFDAQDEEYRESVLPSNVAARVAVEAGIADYWYKYVGLKGAIVGMTGYGESAPADKLFPFFGFTAENIVAKAHKVLGVKGAWWCREAVCSPHPHPNPLLRGARGRSVCFLGPHLRYCVTGDPQRGPGVWPMPVIAGGLCGVTHQAKTLTVKAPARLNATIA